MSQEKEDIIHTLVSSNTAIVDLNLITESAKILKYEDVHEEKIKQESNIRDFTKKLIQEYVQPLDQEAAKNFLSMDNLKSFAQQKKEAHIDLRLQIGKFKYEWVRISVLIFPNSTERLFLLIKNTNHDYLLQNVMEKFIYNNCDYLYYWDLKNNWYLRFSGDEKNSPLPEEEGHDYIKAMIEYVDAYVPKEDREMVKEKMHPDYVLEHLNKNGYLNFTTGVIDNDGNYTRKHLQFQYFDKEHRIVLLQRIDITESYINNKNRKKELEKLKAEAVTDYLTGIYNRAGCEKNIQSFIEQEEELPLSAFLLLDLDNFKSINDHLGHKTGDQVLNDIASILKNSFRKTDIVARLGGDEFVIFLKNIKSKQSILPNIEELLQKLYLKYKNKSKTVQIGASIGISFFPEDGMNFQELYETADKAMYYAKTQKKNAYYIYNSLPFDHSK